MPRMTTVDAEMIAKAISEITSVSPLFRSEEEMAQYMAAVARIAEAVGATAEWGKGAEG